LDEGENLGRNGRGILFKELASIFSATNWPAPLTFT